MKEKVFCKKCNKALNTSQKFCDECGAENIIYHDNKIGNNDGKLSNFIDSKNTKKFIKIFGALFSGVLILVVVGIGISNAISNSQALSAKSSENRSEADDGKLVFDAKKLVGAKKQDVDKLLNNTGTQDENEPYTYHYGDDTDVVFDDGGTCLYLCLDTKEKGYTIFDENKVLKSYGLDLTNSSNKRLSEIVKSYTQINGIGEVEIFYNNKVNESSDIITQIVFYTDSSKKAFEFLAKKSEKFEDELNNNADDQKTTSSVQSTSNGGQFTVNEALQLIQSGKWTGSGNEIKAYANKLNDLNWQKKNGIKNVTQNVVLDINQDGVYEMLLLNGTSEASLKVSVVTYNNGDIKVDNISSDHGGYIGYSSSQKVFFVGGGTQGNSYIRGYKLEGNKCRQVYAAISDEGRVGEKNAHYVVNGKKVSKAEYEKAYKDFDVKRKS